MKAISAMTAGEIISSMNPAEQDNLYRMLWSKHVYRDVMISLADNFPELNAKLDEDIDEKDAFVMEIVNAFVYNSDYDCNLSYWDNINNLISERRNYAD